MAKPLQTLKKQFLQQGLHLLFSFDTTVVPGSIIDRPKPRDVNVLVSVQKLHSSSTRSGGRVLSSALSFTVPCAGRR